jgi:hypothetical protein
MANICKMFEATAEASFPFHINFITVLIYTLLGTRLHAVYPPWWSFIYFLACTKITRKAIADNKAYLEH